MKNRLNNDYILFTVNEDIENPELMITKEGFFVRGVKVEQGEQEAEAVYDAFKNWLKVHTNYMG